MTDASRDPQPCLRARQPFPFQLRRVAERSGPLEVLRNGLSSLLDLGRDRRALLAALDPEATVESYSLKRKAGAETEEALETSTWIDYWAGTGDGFEATGTVARVLAKAQCDLAWNGEPLPTQRGRILLLGAERPELPASPGISGVVAEIDPPDLYAIPGRQDDHDGLSSFRRVFCTQSALGAWRTRQRRTYFALELPHSWWLLGLDLDADGSLDAHQLDFFRSVMCRAIAMRPPGGAAPRVILCVPHFAVPAEFEEEILSASGAVLKLVLAGGLYRSAPDESGKPDVFVSRQGAWYRFLSPWRRPGSTASLAGLYSLYAWILQSASESLAVPGGAPSLLEGFSELASLGGVREILLDSLRVLAHSPSATLSFALGLGSLIATQAPRRRILGGLLGAMHGGAHLAAAIGLMWGAARYNLHVLQLPAESLWQVALFLLEMAVGGGVLGSLLAAGFRWSTRRYGAPEPPAASAAGAPQEDWGFLRLRIDGRGALTLFPVELRGAARGERFAGQGGSRLRAADPPVASLREEPIVIS